MTRRAGGAALVAIVFAAGVLSSYGRAFQAARPSQDAPASVAFRLPRGLESMEIPVTPDNPLTAGKIRLGERLFFDTRLSKTKAMSCETCHVPEKGWTDGLSLSPKFDGSLNTRHTPTLYGVAYYPELYWDGRAKGLEAQILAAWRGQMGADPDAIATEIGAIAGYKTAFDADLGGPPTAARIVQALASFVRTIHAGDTPWDRHAKGEAALAASEVGRGFKVFSDVARCTLCHLPPLFSDTLFHNVGVGFDSEKPDLGRGKFLTDSATNAGRPVPPEAKMLTGAFKTPTLRGLLRSGPYFHDGRTSSWEEAVDFMLKGGTQNVHLDEKLKAWPVTPRQRRQLLAFLRSLTPESKPYPRPTLP